MKTLRIALLSVLCLPLLHSCYSFTGNTLTPEMRTIEVKNFPNNAAYVNTQLAQDFSVQLRNRFLQRTTLKGTTQNPDLMVEGEITGYDITYASVTAAPQDAPGGVISAAQNKLTISVKVHYENKINPSLNFDRTYSDEAAFSSDMDINTIETTQVKIVTERIINKIFNDIVANW